MADRLGVDTGQSFFEKLRIYESEALKIWNDKKDKNGDIVCNAKQKARCQIQHGEWMSWACNKCPAKTRSGAVADEGGSEENQPEE